MNNISIDGKIVDKCSFSHCSYNENFYKSYISVERDSGIVDVLPILLSEKFVYDGLYNSFVHIKGQIRTYNNHNGGRKLIIAIYVQEIKELVNQKCINDVTLSGIICKKPTFRRTPKGKYISDVILAVNREYGKSDYIPCIVWGENAYTISKYDVGDSVQFYGEFHSREYQKQDEILTTYEVSVDYFEVK